MAENYPGPYGLRIYYEVTPSGYAKMEHKLELNVSCDPAPDPGDAMADITIEGTVVDLPASSVVNLIWNELVPLLSSAEAVVTRAELWEYEEGTFNATYISSMDINQAGTNAGTSVKAHADIYTIRTVEGGIMKAYIMENALGGNETQNYSQLSTERVDFVDLLMGDIDSGQHFLGRDTSLPVVFLRCCPGQHEALFKRRFR